METMIKFTVCGASVRWWNASARKFMRLALVFRLQKFMALSSQRSVVSAINNSLFAFLVLAAGTARADDGLTIALVDPVWNGKTIPTDQVCKKFGGDQAKSPALKVEGIPTDADELVLSFNDESYSPMDKGGHGVIRVQLNKVNTIQIQPIPGETDTLPAGISVVARHRGTGWSGTGGAYLPPCSGGRGNTYSIDVSAIKNGSDGSNTTLTRGKIVMGRY